jgi:hypothetical protein
MCLNIPRNKLLLAKFGVKSSREILQFIRMAKQPKIGTKLKQWCEKCKQPTTQRFGVNEATKVTEWICFCCESAKFRTEMQLREIKGKKNREAQYNHPK